MDAVPFNNSYRPGKKTFDFYVRRSRHARPARSRSILEVVLLREPVCRGRKGKPIAPCRSINGLKKYKLGAQIGTTSYDYIVNKIKPDSKPLVYDTNNDAVQALKPAQIDGLVVDLPTAFYVTAVQVPDGKVVGQFASRGTKEHFGLVFQKGNSLTACVNRAIDRLWANGTIKNLQRIWLAKATGAPVLK